MFLRASNGSLFDEPSTNFVDTLLPLYHGEHVKIRIGNRGPEYTVSKGLLCKQSPYFAGMFNGKFREGEKQSATLHEIHGVISHRSFRALLQWVYLGRVIFEKTSSANEAISAIIEFSRFADMCQVTGMELDMAARIRTLIVINQASQQLLSRSNALSRDPDTNMNHVTSANITSVSFLPEGHAVRSILAAAAVEGYLRRWDGHHKFHYLSKQVPSFACDLLNQVKLALKSTNKTDLLEHKFRDPISGVAFPMFNELVAK